MGSEHSQMLCASCGAEVSDSATFCPACGHEIDRESKPRRTARLSRFQALGNWKHLVALFCFAFVVAMFSGGSPTEGVLLPTSGFAVGDLAGYALAFFLFILLVSGIVFGIASLFTKANQKRVFLSALIISSLALGGLMIFGHWSTVLDSWSATRDLHKSATTLLDYVGTSAGTVNAQASTSSPDLRNATTEEKQELSMVLDSMRPIVKQERLAEVKLQTQLNNLELQSLLAPINLVTQSGINHDRYILAAFGRVVREFDVTAKKNLLNLKLIQYEIPNGEFRAGFVSSFNKSLEKMASLENEEIADLLKIRDTAREIVDLCGGLVGQTSVKNGRILFPQMRYVNSYNGLLRKLGKEVAAEAELEREIHQRRLRGQRAIESLYNASGGD